MEILLNGEPREIDDTTTAQQLIEQLGLAERRLAVEVNREILPRSRFAEHRFQPGDRVEIVQAIGGG
ncbi:sulfur carrier protein ThiS [Thiohalobacter sp.]|uniref:sulfur carrier protein ThiS n=1 Tax=Thiohalobacter sp. TaxID=2025948 RepID=UPI0026111841|nr:sulfur carrier protein ThiS [Thiohalobacter sp.]